MSGSPVFGRIHDLAIGADVHDRRHPLQAERLRNGPICVGERENLSCMRAEELPGLIGVGPGHQERHPAVSLLEGLQNTHSRGKQPGRLIGERIKCNHQQVRLHQVGGKGEPLAREGGQYKFAWRISSHGAKR